MVIKPVALCPPECLLPSSRWKAGVWSSPEQVLHWNLYNYPQGPALACLMMCDFPSRTCWKYAPQVYTLVHVSVPPITYFQWSSSWVSMWKHQGLRDFSFVKGISKVQSSMKATWTYEEKKEEKTTTKKHVKIIVSMLQFHKHDSIPCSTEFISVVQWACF